MSDLILRQQARELRGTILRTLFEAYGSESNVTLKSIARVAGRKESDRSLHAEIEYLIDAGYAARVPHARDALDDNPTIDYRLTGKGRQVLNGDLADVSIDL